MVKGHRSTHCRRGHELSEGNVYVTKKGRQCLTCRLSKCRENKRTERKLHPEKNRESQRLYRERYPEKDRAKSSLYSKSHPESNRVRHNRRRTRLAGNGGDFTVTEWKELCRTYLYRCLCCGKKKPLTADHVIPVILGGSSNIDNIQPLCQPCNSHKHTGTTDFRGRALCR